MRRSRITRSTIGGLLVLTVALSGCAAAEETTGPDPDPSETTEPIDGPAGFPYDAARLCTAVANDHLDVDLRAASFLALEVVEHDRDDTEPRAEELDGWIAGYEERRAVLLGLVERLDGLPTDAAEEGEVRAWDAYLASFDEELDVIDERLEALQGDAPVADFVALGLGLGGDGGDGVAALESLGIDWSDCLGLAAAAPVDEEHRAFVASAAETCTAIAIRRIDGGFAEDQTTVLNVVAAVVQGKEPALDGVAEALDRTVAEWRATADAFAAVADAPAGFDQVIEASQERHALAEERRASLDDPAWREAVFQPGGSATAGLAHPGFDFAALGLEQRSCRGVGA